MKSKLNLVSNWTERALRSKFQISRLAESCSVCPRQLRRYIRDTTGLAPRVWLRRLRLLRAAKLLADGLAVKEVAGVLEFQQASHFSREFKRLFGMPPSHYEIVLLHKSELDTPKSDVDMP